MINQFELSLEQLEKLKNAELDILLEIDRVCKKNNIMYSLTAGTLLGAIRHKGFIPWDDDIDILMLRSEYDKFKEIAAEELEHKYIFVDAWNNKSYGLMFGKVMNINTIMKETSIAMNNAPAGVFVDIFPIEPTYDSEKRREQQFKKARKIKRCLLCRGGYYFGQTGIKLWSYRFRGLMLKILKKQIFLDAYYKNLGNIENSSYAVFLAGTNTREKDTFPIEIFNKYKEIEFEGHKFMSIENTELFLTLLYGDYMTLPPIEQRVPHHLVTELRL